MEIEEARRQTRIILAEENKEFFGRYYFPHYFENDTPEWHFELDNIVAEAKEKAEQGRKGAVIIAPRGHAKSTRLTFVDVIHNILFDDFQEFILILSDTAGQVEKLIGAIKSEFELNEKLREDFGEMVGDRFYPVQSWNNSNLTICWPHPTKKTKTGRPYTYKTKLIAGRSTGTSIRGLKHRSKRPTMIILDDAENRESVESPTQRDKTLRWFWADVVPMLAPKGVLLAVGTILHYDCLLEHLVMATEMFDVVRFSAIKPDGTPLWPDRFPLKELAMLRASMGSLLFNQEYMNIPISADEQIFPGENFSWYTGREVVYDDDKGWLFRDQVMTLYMGVDPAIEEKTQSDDTSISVIGITEKTHDVIVIENRSGKWPFPKQVKEVLEAYYDYIPYMIGIEKTAYQKALKQQVQEKEVIPVRGLNHTGSKYMRLVRMSPVQESGKIWLREAIEGEPGDFDPMGRVTRRIHKSCFGLFVEMTQYPRSPHDDKVDSLENAVSLSGALKFFQKKEVKKDEVAAVEAEENEIE